MIASPVESRTPHGRIHLNAPKARAKTRQREQNYARHTTVKDLTRTHMYGHVRTHTL